MTMDPSQPVTPVPPAHPAEAPMGPAAPGTTIVAAAPRAKSRGVLDLLLVGAAILAIGGVAFAIGRSTAPASAFPGVGGIGSGPIVRSDGSFAPGAGGPGGFALDGGLAIDGTVTSVDADSITIELANGEEMTFALDGDTTYREATDASPADVAVGDAVSVQVDGGGRVRAGDGESTTPDLTAGDVTISR